MSLLCLQKAKKLMRISFFSSSLGFSACSTHFSKRWKSTSEVADKKCCNIAFSLSKLPLHLQQEFDTDENQTIMSHSCQNRQTVVISCTSCCKVVWKCRHCQHKWMARPVDRITACSSHFFNCPQCKKSTVESSRKSFSDLSSSSNSKANMLLRIAFPHLAYEWRGIDIYNTHSNLQHYTFFNVIVNSPAIAKWKCSRCAREWKQSVRNRVRDLEQQAKHFPKGTVRTFCPDCEMQIGKKLTNKTTVLPKIFLSNHTILLSQALLSAHQNPQVLPLTSGTHLRWRCPYCLWEYTAALRNRFLYHEGCPNCARKEKHHFINAASNSPSVLKEKKQKRQYHL